FYNIISISMKRLPQAGFTIVELMLACVIFPIIVIGIINAYGSVTDTYSEARQYNEMYAVLSACPEIDRALEYTSLSSNTNCFPNNTFAAAGGTAGIITYSPTVTVTDTTGLPSADPLKTVPDSKVIYITVPFLHDNVPDLKL